MIDKETLSKMSSCKALQGLTVADIVAMPRFKSNLGAYLDAQTTDRRAIRESYEAMHKLGGAKGYKLPAHPIDRVMDLSVEQFAEEYLQVVYKSSKRPSAERRYILQLGRQAYNLTVAQIAIEEFPELEPVLLPKSNAN